LLTTKIHNRLNSVKSLSDLFSSDIDLEMKVSIIQNSLYLAQIMANYLIADEVMHLTGDRYKRKNLHTLKYYRWGFNTGSIKIDGKKFSISVPRVYDRESNKNVSLKTYEHLHNAEIETETIYKTILKGLSTRDYGGIVNAFINCFGLSKSTLSKEFIKKSSEAVKEFTERRIDNHRFISILIDGKYLANEQIIIVLGVTDEGKKIPLDFIQSYSENSTCIKQLLSRLIDRGLSYEEGLLFITDGSKGIIKAIKETFGHLAVLQRCQWHKKENVISYLNDNQKDKYSKEIQKAYNEEDYETAKEKLLEIRNTLEKINKNAANSLMEGLEETLTLKRLNLDTYFQKSFSTTNLIENLNSQIKKYTGNVKRWESSDQKQRWIASALLTIETKMNKVKNYRLLHILKEIIAKEVKNNMLE